MICLGFFKSIVSFVLCFLKCVIIHKQMHWQMQKSKLYHSPKVSSMGEICQKKKKNHMTFLTYASISVRHNQARSDMRQHINLTV